VARRLLLISNGHGEDSIGAEIVRRLPDGIEAEAYPTLGSGQAYEGVCPIVGPRARLASEGSRAGKGTVSKDVFRGGLATIPPGLAFMHRARKHYDRVFVVGDFIGVAGCWLAGLRGVIYVDVYRSGYGRHYWPAERAIIARTCATTFCRSESLAAGLRAGGADARFAGNIMLDTIPFGDYSTTERRHSPLAITLLPGSRGNAVENFAKQMAAIRALAPALQPDVFVALAPGVDPEALASVTGMELARPAGSETGDAGALHGSGLTVHLTRDVLGNLLEASDLVLSQAGTASIQAVGFGLPVLTFQAEEGRASRQRDLAAMFGPARVVTRDDATEYLDALQGLLRDGPARERLGAIGRKRIGGDGAMASIISRLLE
jgi:uncharacterized protein (TIGR03492 family)